MSTLTIRYFQLNLGQYASKCLNMKYVIYNRHKFPRCLPKANFQLLANFPLVLTYLFFFSILICHNTIFSQFSKSLSKIRQKSQSHVKVILINLLSEKINIKITHYEIAVAAKYKRIINVSNTVYSTHKPSKTSQDFRWNC